MTENNKETIERATVKTVVKTTGKTVVLGVCGGIAAYKVAYVASALTQAGVDVHVIMTKNATEFISPMTFETLTANRVIADTFDRNFQWDVKHVSLAKKADLFVIAPATANMIAKMAYGIADDMLSTTVLAASCKKLVFPAMNTGMYNNPATQRNIDILKNDGMFIFEPASGYLACGDVGAGRLPEPDKITECVKFFLNSDNTLKGKKVLVTAGATREAIDPVRYITNHSTGKMGYAIARRAAEMGAQVVLVSGQTNLEAPFGVEKIDIVSARDMFEAVKEHGEDCDIIIKAAAVADYRPKTVADQKIKKSEGDAFIDLERTDDILKYLGEHKKKGQVICGFSMETENLLENSRKKLDKKNADMIAANSIRQKGAGFASDTNIVTLITRDGAEELECMDKYDVADIILKRLADMM